MRFASMTAGTGTNERRVYVHLEGNEIWLEFAGRGEGDLLVTGIRTHESYQTVINTIVEHVEAIIRKFKEEPEDCETYVHVEDALEFCNQPAIEDEQYREFIHALAHKRAEVNSELQAVRHAMERVDDCDAYVEYGHEVQHLESYLYNLERTQKFFMDNTDTWAYFRNVDYLKMYVDVMKKNYEAMTAYTYAVCPLESGELVGVTQEEWDEHERYRDKLGNKLSAWVTFTWFCEHGEEML